MNDLVSIIMPSYNTGNFIMESIKSVLNQSYQNWELIIIDDCSTDETDSIIKTLTDSRIKYIKNEKNLGAAISRNKALKIATGKWIAFLDSDDLWTSDKLEKQLYFMKKIKCFFSYTCYEEINEKGNSSGKIVSGPKKITKHKMYNYCWPGCLTVMYNVDVIGTIQIKDIKKNNDYALWLKICEKADCYLCPMVLAQYRKGRTGSISTQKYKTLIKWHYKLWRDVESKNTIICIINTMRNLVFGIYKKIKYVHNK